MDADLGMKISKEIHGQTLSLWNFVDSDRAPFYANPFLTGLLEEFRMLQQIHGQNGDGLCVETRFSLQAKRKRLRGEESDTEEEEPLSQRARVVVVVDDDSKSREFQFEVAGSFMRRIRRRRRKTLRRKEEEEDAEDEDIWAGEEPVDDWTDA
ncbi:MAG: hypothetical protein M1816_006460 [Peltula sp. TS41687]|nr:MAG: hypothetical protein M1816_006460 [Peltula sp. TS41687]